VSALRAFWASTIGKKIVMAVTGLIGVGFVVGHMLGNLQVFLGPTKFNAYAHFLRSLGELLWIVRGVLLEDPPLYVPDRVRSGLAREEASSVAQMFPLLQQLARDMQARNAALDEWVGILEGAPALSGRGSIADVLGPAGVRAMAEAFSRLDPEIFTPAIEGAAISGGGADLSEPLACPAVVLRADPALGPAFTASDEERFLRTNPHARVVLVEGASHQIHDEQPDRFRDELSALASRVAV
jgi:pimeloyl-ACP methyl ester carboxylesterase